jgi:2,5-diamino-6-(ribosylamino)-4(3H)-pyrimidinone 5'-phosphate reductase
VHEKIHLAGLQNRVEGLGNEVSLLVVPGIDGRHNIPAVFDGVGPSRKTAVPLRLKSVEQRVSNALWIRYEVVRS